MSDIETRFHELWLGMVQPIEGLVVSLPVLVDAQCMQRQPTSVQHRLLELCPVVDGQQRDDGEAARRIGALGEFLHEMLKLSPDLFDIAEEFHEDLHLYVPEGRQTIVPSLALKKINVGGGDGDESGSNDALPDDSTPASRAGARYEMLVWELPEDEDGGLDLDKGETVTGPWDYPPAAKFDRLLRHCRVPIGLLTNGRVLRLVYAPHGESSGAITFRIDDMATVGGRPILDAFVMLLSATRFFGVAEEHQLPAILAESRKRQASVTEDLADQVFDALQILLNGFAAAAERDRSNLVDDALNNQGDDHLYQGLLTVLLRLVFVLYAEDRDLLPVENEHYAEHLSGLALFSQLQQDADAYPDSMHLRFGAWGRLISLFRAIYLGVQHGDLYMPPRHGQLFDPHRFPFLEGWGPAGSAPISLPEQRADVKVPTVDDRTIFEVMHKLLIFKGQRLSYRALDVEQIGSVYEALMGYHVQRAEEPMVCLKGDKKQRVWLGAGQVLAVGKIQRAKWLKENAGLSKARATKLADAVAGCRSAEEALPHLETMRVKSTATARAGRLVLQPGDERKRTSSHYTPRSFSAPIVRRTLEPLLAAMGNEPSSDALLQLKICDPAMGSGAFLVEACRFLADQLVAAWTREDRLEEVAKDHEDPVNHARRLVAQCCLYGVDKNPFAVNLAKLSLWLVTLAKGHPFTFVDHCLRCGDSLVGLDFDQITSFHWQPSKQMDLCRKELDDALSEAIELRQEILALAHDGSPEATRAKARLLDDAEDALNRVRLIGDLAVGAFFAGKKDKDREKERTRRLDMVVEWLREDSRPPAELVALQQEIKNRLPVFHWMVEFPEVFYAGRPDPLEKNAINEAAYLDAVLGNPPFLGGRRISGTYGDEYATWLEQANSTSKNADLCAQFFRRADQLLGTHGTLGLIATNTIAQGDTRSSGLQPLVRSGQVIYDATKSTPWPGDAAVAVSIVHLAKGTPEGKLGVTRRLDGRNVRAINSRLRPSPERLDPTALKSNTGMSFQGTVVVGLGFTLTPEERDDLIRLNSQNADRIFPYLGGEEVNSSSTHAFHRYVINFGSMPLEQAEKWPDLIKIIREKVKPDRDKVKREAHRKYWWHYGDKRPALYEAIRELPRCLVTARVSKHLMFSLQPTDRIFSEQLYVFPLPRYAHFALLQSRVHEPWAWLLSSTMREAGIRYGASDCFETFPFPDDKQIMEGSTVDQVGERLYETRAKYMVDTDQGLTKTYNALKDAEVTDPAIVALRDLHLDMDRAVLAAYGWDDIEPPPFTTPVTDTEKKVREAFEDEVIDRLFVLNAERAEKERLTGLGAKSAKSKKAAKKKTSNAKQLKLA